jgi:response regulator RpfG family c-di-GMP phosphodiesterase
MNQTTTRVLCVDDEPQVLEGLSVQLRRGYEVHTATSGDQGLETIEKSGPFAVVLSDMRMPRMDGATFLRNVREVSPDSTRMLLTGQTDMKAAIAAVNEGQIFRFLTKPCPPEQLRLSFEAAAKQYRLVTAERVLLEQTLHGSIKTLTEVLAMTNPFAFGRASRIRQLVHELAVELGLADRWQVEVAAMLSQLGSITVPETVIEKHFCGEGLSEKEQAMIARAPAVAEALLANIPRLEGVREILAEQNTPFKGEKEIPIGARILRIAVDFDNLEARGSSVQLALDTMCGRKDTYDQEILRQFLRIKKAVKGRQVQEIPLRAVRVGMVFAEDVRSKTGMLLVARGYEVSPSFVERARNHWEGTVREPLRILVETEKGPEQ